MPEILFEKWADIHERRCNGRGSLNLLSPDWYWIVDNHIPISNNSTSCHMIVMVSVVFGSFISTFAKLRHLKHPINLDMRKNCFMYMIERNLEKIKYKNDQQLVCKY